jgi:hypothetical protein
MVSLWEVPELETWERVRGLVATGVNFLSNMVYERYEQLITWPLSKMAQCPTTAQLSE